jgi:hypothetical protein
LLVVTTRCERALTACPDAGMQAAACLPGTNFLNRLAQRSAVSFL